MYPLISDGMWLPTLYLAWIRDKISIQYFKRLHHRSQATNIHLTLGQTKIFIPLFPKRFLCLLPDIALSPASLSGACFGFTVYVFRKDSKTSHKTSDKIKRCRQQGWEERNWFDVTDGFYRRYATTKWVWICKKDFHSLSSGERGVITMVVKSP